MPGTTLTIALPEAGDSFRAAVDKLAVAVAQLQADIEPKIDSGALDLRSALGLNGFALFDVGGLRLTGGESSVVGTLYMDGSGDLHVVTGTADVQITQNGAIDVAALGTIGGDYGGANPASVTFNDTSGEYRFLEETGVWATLKAEDLVLVGSAGTVRIGVDSAITGDKEFNIKALPASGVGGLAFEASSQSLVDASATRETLTHQFTSVDLTGTVNVDTRTIVIGPAEMQPRNDGGLGATMTNGYAWVHNTSGASQINVPIRLPAGAVIETVKWYGSKGSATGTISAQVRRLVIDGTLDAAVGTVGSNNTNAPGAINFSNAAPFAHTMLSGNAYYVAIFTSGQANDYTYAVEVTYSGVAI